MTSIASRLVTTGQAMCIIPGTGYVVLPRNDRTVLTRYAPPAEAKNYIFKTVIGFIAILRRWLVFLSYVQTHLWIIKCACVGLDAKRSHCIHPICASSNAKISCPHTLRPQTSQPKFHIHTILLLGALCRRHANVHGRLFGAATRFDDTSNSGHRIYFCWLRQLR